VNKCHVNIGWRNDQTPAINETNLNYMDGCIDTIDDRVVTFDTTKANESDLLTCVASISYDTATGIMTITLKNGTSTTIDTGLSKLSVNFDYDDDPTSVHYQQLIIEMADGTYKYVDLSALLTQYEFTNTSTIAFTTDISGAVSANVVDGSITGTKLQPNYLADVTAQANAASASASSANTDQLKSEGYANGTQNGTPVTSGSPYYENNAKYWKEQAQAIASASLSGLSDVSITSPQDGQLLTYDAGNSEWVNGDAPKGMLPHINITTTTGSTVTLTKGANTITATETSTGLFEADVDEFGTWTITVSFSSDTATDTINVDTVKVYSITITFFAASITATYPVGATCTLSATGQQTQTATTNPYTFVVESAATYTVTATDGVNTDTKNVVITTSGQTESVTLSFIPDGSTVTPVNDIQTWLLCAGIKNKPYTTLAEVIADSQTLLSLISDNNAVDYMVRSTSFASDTCADALAMLYIGEDNYCATALQADNTWNTAITGSSYSDLVLIPPTASSHTLKTFAAANEAEILEMVCKADRGEIDLYDDAGWRVGQEHSTTISAISNSGTYDGISWTVSGATMPDDTQITLALMHKGLYELQTPVLDKQGQTRNTCSFVVGTKDCVTQGSMTSDTSVSDYSTSWNGCERRNWCNGGFRGALSAALRGAFKQFKTKTINTYNGSTITTSVDYFALPAEKEVFGSASTFSNATERNALTQFTWYETSANISKANSGRYNRWWFRSPAYLNAANARWICYADGYNNTPPIPAGYYDAVSIGISPFGAF